MEFWEKEGSTEAFGRTRDICWNCCFVLLGFRLASVLLMMDDDGLHIYTPYSYPPI